PVTDPDVQPLPRGGFRCRLCQITAANRPSLVSHLSGKRHRRLRALRAERREQELRSLFVSGFARGTDPAELRRHFGSFGGVTGVVMDKDKGAFAIVELSDPSERQRALEHPRHSLGGRRLRVRPREHKTFPRPPPRTRGPPETPQARGLQEALGQAPDVEAQLELLVQLLELSEAERRLRSLLVSLFQEVFSEFFPGCSIVPFGSSVNGFDVHGCDLDLHLELPGGPEDPPEDPPPTLLGDMDPPRGPQTGDTEPPQGPQTGDTDPPRGPHTKGLLTGDREPLEDPHPALTGDRDPPGGTLMGDVDPPPTPPTNGSLLGSEGSPWGSEGPPREGSLLDDGDPPTSEGSVSEDEGSLLGPGGGLGGAPPGRVLALVGSVLRRCVPGVRGVRAVPGARRPVVKFSHKQSGLEGDVCVHNRLALFNTRFLRLCADADPRVRPLGYGVRAWARARGLAGNPSGGGPLLTNYALTLLVVVFLQTRSPPVLPSGLRLRDLAAGPEDRAEVGGWDCSFPRDPSVLEPSGNTQSTGERTPGSGGGSQIPRGGPDPSGGAQIPRG
ncbi:STPAP polymerase, partial [Onychorhynchus coronatus]|nr:STPAP polymerase [Onychorhynchus coronatus]